MSYELRQATPQDNEELTCGVLSVLDYINGTRYGDKLQDAELLFIEAESGESPFGGNPELDLMMFGPNHHDFEFACG